MNTQKNALKIIMIIVLLSSLVLLLLAGGTIGLIYHFEEGFVNRSVPVNAEVIRITQSRNSDGESVYRRIFAFTMPDSTLVHEARETWASSKPNNLSGQKIDIRVDSQDLTSVKIDDWISLHMFTLIALMISVTITVGIILNVIFIAVVAFLIQRNAKKTD